MNETLNPILLGKVRANLEQQASESSVANPVGADAPDVKRRKRRTPMSVAKRTMEVEAIPGFHLHWFSEINVPRALEAGYDHVKRDEVDINQKGIGASNNMSGNTDMGTNVSIVGTVSDQGPVRAYLMKLPNELRKEDVEAMAEIAHAPLKAIFVDEDIAGPDGTIVKRGDLIYVKTALLNRPARKAKVSSR